MELTDRNFWRNYWLSKPELFEQPIERRSLFKPLFNRVIQGQVKDAIEIGGFPGTFSALLHFEYGIKCDLADYFIDEELFNQFLSTNQLNKDSISAFEIDVFKDFEVPKQYDLVYSIGLIEHFEKTKQIIDGHIRFMKEDGVLLLIIPNFRGINGWFQRVFDRSNYDKHYINCMDPEYLKSILAEYKYVEGDYFGGFTIWLENYKSQPIWVRLFFKSVWILGKLLSKVFTLKNRQLSPYIYIIASNRSLVSDE